MPRFSFSVSGTWRFHEIQESFVTANHSSIKINDIKPLWLFLSKNHQLCFCIAPLEKKIFHIALFSLGISHSEKQPSVKGRAQHPYAISAICTTSMTQGSGGGVLHAPQVHPTSLKPSWELALTLLGFQERPRSSH